MLKSGSLDETRESMAHEPAAPSVVRHSCTLDVSVTASQLPKQLNWTCCTAAPMSSVAVILACTGMKPVLMFLTHKHQLHITISPSKRGPPRAEQLSTARPPECV